LRSRGTLVVWGSRLKRLCTIVIANAGTSELRYHDARGSWLRSVGGQGEGPGEFRTLTNIWRMRGDTLLAWDTRLRRLSFFAPGGEFVGSRIFVIAPVRLPSGMSMTNSVIFQGVFADGSIVARNNSGAARQLAVVLRACRRVRAPAGWRSAIQVPILLLSRVPLSLPPLPRTEASACPDTRRDSRRGRPSACSASAS
jgi:hypothetical protein